MCSAASLGKVRPSDFQKRVLVLAKKFKTKEEIPELISPGLLDRAKSELRIKISNILIVLTIIASIGAVISGKRAAKRGESVHQKNIDWHRDYNEEHNKNAK